jgi:hypothetical protein
MILWVALGLAVVAWRVGLGLLVAGAMADDAGEVVGAVAGAVVGDDAVDVGDAVGGEPDLGSGEECGCGRALLVVEWFGVGQSGEPVHDGVQVEVTGLGACGFGAVDCPLLGAVAAVDAPPAAVGDPADLLHVQMCHVTRPAGDDLAGLAVAVTAGVDEPALTKPESGQVAGDGAAVDAEVQLGQFVGDPVGRPLLLPPPGLDPLNDPCRGRVRTVVWG